MCWGITPEHEHEFVMTRLSLERIESKGPISFLPGQYLSL